MLIPAVRIVLVASCRMGKWTYAEGLYPSKVEGEDSCQVLVSLPLYVVCCMLGFVPICLKGAYTFHSEKKKKPRIY
jgi:hypothetical protein